MFFLHFTILKLKTFDILASIDIVIPVKNLLTSMTIEGKTPNG